MKTSTFAILYLFFALGAIGSIVVREYRYELGITKPKFQAGDCARTAYKDEFSTTYDYSVILQVGKSEYNTMWYDYKSNRSTGSTIGIGISRFDSEYEKVSCPDKISVI